MGSSTEHSAYGPTANPWALDRVPGGSSGGSAAAVAAFHAPLSIGTDTGGSIRQPAALCGIVGMKPTYGRVSRYGIVAFASSLDQIGPFARDVARRRGAPARGRRPRRPRFDLVARAGAGDPHGAAGRRRRGRGARSAASASACRASTSWPGMEPGVEARVREAVAALEAAGATVEEVSLPHTDYGLATYYIVAPAEASANLARYDGIRYGPRLGDGDVLANYLATRGQGFGAGGQAPDHARHVRAVGRLLRRLLPEGAEGPDADQGRLRRALGAGLRRPGRADLADRRLPLRRRGWPTRSRCTCRTPARCRSTWPACRACRSRAGCPTGCRSASSSSARPGPRRALFGLARGYEAITADARRGAALEPAELSPPAADPGRGPPPARARSAARRAGAARRRPDRRPTGAARPARRARPRGAGPDRAAVGDPALLRHRRDDGRRHQPRRRRARLRHAAGHRRGRRREPARGPDALHQQLRARSSCDARCRATSSAATASATTRPPRS